MLEQLEQLGFCYDASIFPSYLYRWAKSFTIKRLRRRGCHTAAYLGDSRLLKAPRHPYRLGRQPWLVGHRQIFELPLSVVGVAGWPLTGATLTLAPSWLRQYWRWCLHHQQHVLLGFHAMDFIDPVVDQFPDRLIRHQPELHLPIHRRWQHWLDVLKPLTKSHSIISALVLAERLHDRLK